jgi:hypothetical protein
MVAVVFVWFPSGQRTELNSNAWIPETTIDPYEMEVRKRLAR